MATSTSKQQFDYDMGDFWRSAWLMLAKKYEHARLQSKQERIESRAVFANNRVGRAMAAFDAVHANEIRELAVSARRTELLAQRDRIDAALAALN